MSQKVERNNEDWKSDQDGCCPRCYYGPGPFTGSPCPQCGHESVVSVGWDAYPNGRDRNADAGYQEAWQ